MLQNKYLITHKFSDEGGFGVIYEGRSSDGQAVIVKVTDDEINNYKEHQVLLAIN